MSDTHFRDLTSIGRGQVSVQMLAFFLIAACGPAEPPAVVEIASPASAGSAQPNLAMTPGGHPVMSWLSPDNGATLQFSVLDGTSWSPPVTIASGNDWFVNWADFPSVVPVSDSLWGAHWLRRTADSAYAYDVVLSVSKDAGKTWTEGIVPHDDGTASEHGFVSLFPDRGGLGALWLDGRETLGHGGHHESSGGGMTLRSAVLDEQERIEHASLVDGLVCDCCQTDIAMTPEGPIAVYRDRSDGEIRDIYVSKLLDGQWTEGFPVAADNWEIAGCPVNGPSVSYAHELVSVSWFTAAGEVPRVRVAFSIDYGRSFSTPVDIDTDLPAGRVAVLGVDQDTALVTWIGRAEEGMAPLLAALATANGSVGSPTEIAKMDRGRLSGFPQVAAVGDEILFAWTHVGDDMTSVRTAVAPITLFPTP